MRVHAVQCITIGNDCLLSVRAALFKGLNMNTYTTSADGFYTTYDFEEPTLLWTALDVVPVEETEYRRVFALEGLDGAMFTACNRTGWKNTYLSIEKNNHLHSTRKMLLIWDDEDIEYADKGKFFSCELLYTLGRLWYV